MADQQTDKQKEPDPPVCENCGLASPILDDVAEVVCSNSDLAGRNS